MPVNELQATIDAIAESDNEIGGTLISRTRERAHIFGQNDALVTSGAPTQLTSLLPVYDAGMVGMGLDIIQPVAGALTGNEGSYVIATYVSPTAVTLNKINGAAAAFVSQDPVRWRFTTLRVESALGFPRNDRVQSLWIGEEPAPIPYAQTVLTPSLQEFRGLGPQRMLFGTITIATNTISAEGAVFSAADVGRALWVYPRATLNGNEGPRLITAVAGDGKSGTVSGAVFAATESTDARFAIKDYSTDIGHLSGRVPHRPKVRASIPVLSDVVDASQSYSAIDKLRRALLTAYAEGDELDRIGRRYGVQRLPALGDEIYRCLLQTLPYLPKGTVYGLELLLECLYPGGGWEIYEDLESFPNQVFILLDSVIGTTNISEGKTWMVPTGADVTPSVDPVLGGTPQGQRKRERKTITGVSAMAALAHTPTKVVDLLVEPYLQTLEMGVLPSAAAPAWTFVSVAGGAEGPSFAIVATGPGQTALEHTPDAAPPSSTGGRYSRALDRQDWVVGSRVAFGCWWKPVTLTLTPGHPWSVEVDDSVVGRKYGAFWSPTGWLLGGTLADPGAVSGTWSGGPLVAGRWYRIEVVRETRPNGRHEVVLYRDGKEEARANVAGFVVSGGSTISFGYSGSAGQDWTVYWDRVRVQVSSTRNHFNLRRADGAFAGTAQMTSAAALFVAGDTGRKIRIRTGDTRARGVWGVTYVSGTTLALAGVVQADVATVGTELGLHYVDTLDPSFVAGDVGKQITLSGSVLGNNGTRTILAYVNPKRVRVSGAVFVNEQGIDWRFHPYDGVTSGNFPVQSGVEWELVDAGTVAGTTVTPRDPFPIASGNVDAQYTTIPSAQILRNEFVANEGAAAGPPDEYYPFYVFDVDRATRALVDSVTIAGVLPAYKRIF